MSKIAADLANATESEFPLVGALPDGSRSTVRIGDVALGDERFVVIAGPCAVENREQIELTARWVHEHGGSILRGGAYKPRTSPYSFQGLGAEGVELLRRASMKAGIPFVTEVLSPADVDELSPRVDAFQVGTRNMHNFALLDALGRQSKPVMLKRGFGATLREWILAAEYIARGGNDQIVLCERGIRAFGEETRFVLDIAGALWVREHTRLPVIVDPSHATGVPSLVSPLCRAALAAGLDGAMVELHPDPTTALSDADQALRFEEFEALMDGLAPIATAVGRRL